MNVPKAKKISDKKIIEMLRKELKRKDDEILRLREEKELLFKVSVKSRKDLIEK